MRSCGIVLLALAICAGSASISFASTRDELLVQTQAADVLGGVLTDAVSHATAEIDAARRHPATQPSTASAVVQPMQAQPHPHRITYRELFDRTVERIKKQGNAAIDPALANMPAGQLFDEMTSMQQYNIAQYLRLLRLLDAIQSSHVPTTMPSLESLAQQNASNSATWQKQQQEVRYAVVARILNGSSPRQGQAPQAGSMPNGNGGAYGGSSAIDDPRWSPYFYGSQNAMNGWNGDLLIDPFASQNSGGAYYRTDIRVNRDYDPRTNGFFDRRVNIESDRRLNIHVDPRENF